MGSTRTSQESDDELAQFLITIPISPISIPREAVTIFRLKVTASRQTQSFEGGFHPFTEKPPSIASTWPVT